MKKEKNISSPKIGMSKSISNYLLKDNYYTHMLNGQTHDQSGNRLTISNEHSNILANKFKEGYIVVGFKNEVISNKTYFFLLNPVTKISEFGCILNTTNISELEDKLTDCEDCHKKSKNLSTPLENITQVSHQEYTTLLEDSCNKCLNLDINFPIKDIEIKTENIGTVLFFTDGFNEPRYIELDNLEQYLFENEEVCLEQGEPTCLDCDKLKIFKLYKYPEVVDYQRILGGSLNKGVYEAAFVYCDQLGNELSSYTPLTNTISIFDENDLIQSSDSEANERTNFGIRIELNNLDNKFTHYKIVLIETSFGQAQVLKVSGIYTTSDTVIIISDNQGEPITRNRVLIPKVSVKSWDSLSASNDILFGYGVKENNIPNLQPVFNLMGGALKWNTSIAKEDLYEKPNSNQFKGFNRDEIVPFGIEPISCDGFKYPVYPLIPRPANEEELEEIDNTDTQSILETISDCDNNIRSKRWQFYNTAKEQGSCSLEGVETVLQNESVRTFTEVEVPSAPSGEITIIPSEEDNFSSIKSFIEDNQRTCTVPYDNSLISNICPFIDLNNLESFNTVPELGGTCEEPQLLTERLEVVEVINEVQVFTNKKLENYARVRPPQVCQVIDSGSGLDSNDLDFSSQFSLRFLQSTPSTEGSLRKRTNVTFADGCINSYELFLVSQANFRNYTPQSFIHPYFGADIIEGQATLEESLANILEDKNALFTATYDNGEVGGLTPGQADVVGDAGVFTSKIHKGALWFKIPVLNDEGIIIEIGKLLESGNRGYRLDSGIPFFKNKNIRVHFFYNCITQDPILESSYEDENGVTTYNPLGGIYRLSSVPELIPIDSSILQSNQILDNYIYMVVDLPISQSIGLGKDNFINDDPIAPVIKTAITLPLNSCFSVNARTIEFSKIDITYDEIKLRKVQEYRSTCTFEVPILSDCKPIPFKFGDFGYWESTEKTPDNKELFDSSKLIISNTDIPESYKLDFESFYTDSSLNNYELNSETEFFCKNIRHYKMPNNKIAPFINNNQQATNSNSVIYPLGVTIDSEVVNAFLDIAVNNNLIEQSRRDNIIGYKIHRGDSTLDRSIKSSGLLFDLRTYINDAGDEIKYSNFPYNALGKDKLTNNEVEVLDGTNHSFTYHSPETDYFNIEASELSVQALMFGRTSGVITEVEGHSKWVILGNKARKLATSLAELEAAAEISIKAAELASNAQIQIGFTNNIGLPAFISSAVVLLLGAAEAIVYKVARYRYEWLNIFRDLGDPQNFAYYNTSVSNYNYISTQIQEGDSLRGLSIFRNIKSGFFSIQDERTGDILKINHKLREKTTLLSTNSNYSIEFDSSYKSYDNNSTSPNLSSQSLSSEIGCQTGESYEFNRNTASPYVALKDYIPNQYGTINSIKWIDTIKFNSLLNIEECNLILGGDTYISRHSVKRKAPLFNTTAFELADLTPFNYGFYSNFGEATFFIDYEVTNEINQGGKFFPDLAYTLNTDCGSSNSDFYFRPPSKFYLYYYGQPYFLTETRINTNYRTAKPNPKDQFYPQNRDYINLTQEKTVPIREEATYNYNNNYSYQGTQFSSFQLPSYYSKEVYDKIANNKNTVMYSLPDNNENSLTDPWIIFRPLDRFTFPAANGDLKRIKGIESNQILCTFENKTVLYNKVDSFVDGVTVNNVELGNGAIFARRPFTFSDTDIGYVGSQSHALLSCEYGHFIADTKRGQIFKIAPNGQGIEEISKYANGEPNNMDTWFKENLPFKILKDFPELDKLDNPFNGIGLTMGWDSKFRRVFITKKDYKRDNFDLDLVYVPESGTFTDVVGKEIFTLQELINNKTLKEVSWTISFRPETGSWESYFSFYPNYYINHTDYFQTGLNEPGDKFGLWSHLLTYKSKQVFYGEKHPFTIEYPITNKYQSKRLEAINLRTQAKRYHNQYDFAIDDTITFNKAILYNNKECSGLLELVINNGVLSNLSKYPKTKKDSQEILITQNDNQFNFSYFYNRVNSNKNNIPMFTYDENQIDKTINKNAVSFRGKSTLERLTGTEFLVRLTQDKTSQYDLELNWAFSTTQNEN